MMIQYSTVGTVAEEKLKELANTSWNIWKSRQSRIIKLTEEIRSSTETYLFDVHPNIRLLNNKVENKNKLVTDQIKF
jgi:hypothetical protein